MKAFWLAVSGLAGLGLTGCAIDESGTEGDVTGPYTGETRRFVVDSLALPTTNNLARSLGADINGDKTVDNQLGMVIATLSSSGNVTKYGGDMIRSGAIASTLFVRADDLVNDSTVAVLYYGSEGDDADIAGGRIVDGTFVSNRLPGTSAPGSAIVRLPVFDNADPTDLPLAALQMTVTPDGDGYLAAISGAVDAEIAVEHAYQGIAQQLATSIGDHRFMLALLDSNKDDSVSFAEFRANSLITSLFEPDVTIGGVELLSIGFHAHVRPCDDGTCNSVAPASACHDRIVDGTETDVDCGGSSTSCRRCVADERCTQASDCESNACDAGRCRAPTCSDGVRDGFETDVDCGGNCTGCPVGGRCWNGGDCASGQCGVPCTGTGCIDLSGTYESCTAVP